MNKQSQCTNCQWIGKESKARVRNTEDGQIEYRCPKCGAYGSITEAKEQRYTLTIQLNEWAIDDKEARWKALQRVHEMIQKEDNNAVIKSLICQPSGTTATREVAV